MKKALKTALIILIVLLIIGAAIGGYFIWRHHALYIGADAALGAALDDAGVLAAETFDVDVDFEHKYGRSWYEVQFETDESKAYVEAHLDNLYRMHSGTTPTYEDRLRALEKAVAEIGGLL